MTTIELELLIDGNSKGKIRLETTSTYPQQLKISQIKIEKQTLNQINSNIYLNEEMDYSMFDYNAYKQVLRQSIEKSFPNQKIELK